MGQPVVKKCKVPNEWWTLNSGTVSGWQLRRRLTVTKWDYTHLSLAQIGLSCQIRFRSESREVKCRM